MSAGWPPPLGDVVTPQQRRCAAYINEQLEEGRDFNELLAECLHAHKLIAVYAKGDGHVKVWPNNAGWASE